MDAITSDAAAAKEMLDTIAEFDAWVASQPGWRREGDAERVARWNAFDNYEPPSNEPDPTYTLQDMLDMKEAALRLSQNIIQGLLDEIDGGEKDYKRLEQVAIELEQDYHSALRTIDDLKRQLAEERSKNAKNSTGTQQSLPPTDASNKARIVPPVNFKMYETITKWVQKLAGRFTPPTRRSLTSAREDPPPRLWIEEEERLGPWAKDLEDFLSSIEERVDRGFVYDLFWDNDEMDKTVFPFNTDGYDNWAVGDAPTAYDLKYGRFVDVDMLESYVPAPAPNGKLFHVTGRPVSVDWSSGEAALRGIDRSVPTLCWFRNPAGVPILRYHTLSRTRSRTIEFHQELPKNADFKWDEEKLAEQEG